MKYLEAVNDFLNKILMILGGIAVLALMSLATGNVVLRIIGMPYRGAYELVAFLGAVVIAFALGYTQKKKNHIIVDILTDRFSKELQNIIDKFADLVMTIFFAVVTWQMYVWGMKIYESNEVSETLKIPFHPFVFAVCVGFALLSFTSFIDFLKKLFREED
jgi:TRAP-type C4-dicarboxylate transport system permease small subunit